MSLYYDVLDIINQWKPKKKYSKESEYRDNLVEYIRQVFNQVFKQEQETSLFFEPVKHRIKIEHKNIYADIDIDEEIGIELKLNLRGKSEVDRLYGQISGYAKEYENIFIILCGDVKEDIHEEVLYRLKEIDRGWGTILDDPKITVIWKGSIHR